ncbi:hypothetical protein, conserved [Eimeria tenella]|uniref:Phosphatidylinositol-glycan biosynthesis class X protein n=1 Tax=Eimeria tenella TaxID=5802 RepID=U6KR91_EIMTE|nr:hypothetical protein, conserved [Eimeria tenella]CDJ40471.1 hypothetical protein, conserved [Eimeria tenella]|eukprot:XP_013231221.1 hypothetical protein, conserved [Eimeria tenella]
MLQGRGFHRVFETRVQLEVVPNAGAAAAAAADSKGEAEQCLLWLEYRLPQQVFADPDQTHELGAPHKYRRGPPRSPGSPILLRPTTLFKPSCPDKPSSEATCHHGPVLVNVELPSYSPLLGVPPVVRQEVYVHSKMLDASPDTREVSVQLPVHLRYGPPCSGSCSRLLKSSLAAPLVGLECSGRPQQQLTAAATAGAAAGEGPLEFAVPVGQRADWALTVATSGATLALGVYAVVFSLAS